MKALFKNSFIALFSVLLFVTTSCKNNKTLPKIKEKVKDEKIKVNEKILQTTTAIDYKIEHLQTLADLERIKLHFIEETDKFKLEHDIAKLKQRFAKLKNSSDETFNKSITSLEKDLNDFDKMVKNKDKNAGKKLDEMAAKIENEITQINKKAKSDANHITDALKRQYAEIQAKTYLLKAKRALKNNQIDKANEYLDKAYKKYDIAKKYGNKKYQTIINTLQKEIKVVESITKAEKEGKLDAVFMTIKKHSPKGEVNEEYIIVEE